MELSRRTILAASAGALGPGALAGCLEDVARNPDGVEEGYAAFFTLWDWTQQVAGDAATFEDPVDVGDLGHGWEPDGDLAANVASTDAFVYLDSPEFAWAQDIAATLEADYEGIAVIDGLADLNDELLAWDHDHDHAEDGGTGAGEDDHDHAHEGEHAGDHADENESEHADDHAHEDDHDGGHAGDVDPHVWLDPVLAQTVVTTIAGGLADAAPDAAETFEENAAAYVERLEALDESFRTLAEETERDTVVLAGHDSFGYLSERYGFEVHSPVGVSPQEEPSPDDIAGTVDFVDERGIDTVLYDRFDASGFGEYPPLVETILEGSDATTAHAISPAAGTLAEWNDRGWGYLEQMEEINVPAFREALERQ